MLSSNVIGCCGFFRRAAVTAKSDRHPARRPLTPIVEERRQHWRLLPGADASLKDPHQAQSFSVRVRELGTSFKISGSAQAFLLHALPPLT